MGSEVNEPRHMVPAKHAMLDGEPKSHAELEKLSAAKQMRAFEKTFSVQMAKEFRRHQNGSRQRTGFLSNPHTDFRSLMLTLQKVRGDITDLNGLLTKSGQREFVKEKRSARQSFLSGLQKKWSEKRPGDP